MKKLKGSKKETAKTKLKKTKNLVISKQTRRKDNDLWKEISSTLRPFIKTYSNYRKKRKIEKLREENKKLKEIEKERIREEESIKEPRTRRKKIKKRRKNKDRRRKKIQRTRRTKIKRKKD